MTKLTKLAKELSELLKEEYLSKEFDIRDYAFQSAQDYAYFLHILQFSVSAIPSTLIEHTKDAINVITYCNNKHMIIGEELMLTTVAYSLEDKVIIRWSLKPPQTEEDIKSRQKLIEDYASVDELLDSYKSFIRSVYPLSTVDFNEPIELVINIIQDKVLKIPYYLLNVANPV